MACTDSICVLMYGQMRRILAFSVYKTVEVSVTVGSLVGHLAGLKGALLTVLLDQLWIIHRRRILDRLDCPSQRILGYLLIALSAELLCSRWSGSYIATCSGLLANNTVGELVGL